MPISEKQLAANRANAARSTGPRTAEGKARSARNAVKHGFAASAYTVVRLEDLNEVSHLKEDLVNFYQPRNSQELFAVERIALAQQSMLRASRLEAGLCTTAMNEVFHREFPAQMLELEMCGNDRPFTQIQNRNYLLAEGMHRLTSRSANKSGIFHLFLRYQAQSERLYRRAIEDFERIRALTGALPNEPISPSQPEESEPLPDNNLPPDLDLTKDGYSPPPEPEPVHRPEPDGAPAQAIPPGIEERQDCGGGTRSRHANTPAARAAAGTLTSHGARDLRDRKGYRRRSRRRYLPSRASLA